MRNLINQKKVFNPLVLLVSNMFAFLQPAFSEDEKNIYFDLSNEDIKYISIELNTYCTPKNSLYEIYGNGKHNIPLAIEILAINAEGQKISIKKEDIIKFSKIQDKKWGENVSLDNESIMTYSDQYTKCIGENNASFNINERGLYFKSTNVGETVNLGVKFYYQDKKGKQKAVTSDSERLKINVLQNPLSVFSSEAIFTVNLISEYYDSILVNRNNYRLFKISPLIEKFPSLGNVNLEKLRITNKDTKENSDLIAVNFDKNQKLNNYFMTIDYFTQHRGWYGESKRNFTYGYLISGLLKDKANADKFFLDNNNETVFSLNEISSQDFGFITISDSGIPLHVWEYQWEVPFLLELSGYDSFGNYFKAHLQEKF